MKKTAYRVIYNQDWISFFSYTKESMTAAHVDHMVDEVSEGGADLVLINPNGQRVSYPSRVWQTNWDGFSDTDAGHDIRQVKRLADQGCDYLARALPSGRHCAWRVSTHE